MVGEHDMAEFIAWCRDEAGYMGLRPGHVHVELSKPEYCRGAIGQYWAAWTARRSGVDGFSGGA